MLKKFRIVRFYKSLCRNRFPKITETFSKLEYKVPTNIYWFPYFVLKWDRVRKYDCKSYDEVDVTLKNKIVKIVCDYDDLRYLGIKNFDSDLFVNYL